MPIVPILALKSTEDVADKNIRVKNIFAIC